MTSYDYARMKKKTTKSGYHFKLTLVVMNRVGAMARITMVLRKFSLNIYKFEGFTHTDNSERFTMLLWLEGPRENCDYIFKKVERLVDVVEISWKRIK